MDQIIACNARAVQQSVQIVNEARAEDLSKPTPCAGWTLADLLTHMTVQHYGFAAAAEGDGASLSHWQASELPGQLSGQPDGRLSGEPDGRLSGEPDQGRLIAEYALAADRVTGAFAAPGVLDRKFCLPEISTAMLFPARQAIGFHLVDYVVHAWDVARSLGLRCDIDADVLSAALAVAQAVPNDRERRRRPGAPFAPRLDSASDESLDRVLTLLGRDPAWPLVATRP
jgi:uncharacterized protein (TIGR03086 family)